MPHDSADGAAQPPYVNVAFQREEIELEEEGVGIVMHAYFSVFHSCHLKDK